MNLANKITLSRIGLTFVFMFFLFSKGFVFKFLALVVFLLAVLSDYLDGYFAKKLNMVTSFGKLMDPIADKVLVLAAFLAFVEMKLVPAWMVVIIILREMVITGLRLAAIRDGGVLEAGWGGKNKTASQMLSIIMILVFIVFKEAGVRVFGFWNDPLEYWFRQIIFFMMIVTVVLTLVSGMSYIIGNKKYLNHEKNTKP